MFKMINRFPSTRLPRCLVLLLLIYLFHHTTGTTTEHHKYCVVGAGASGLQLTAHLAHDKRDVVLIEKSASVGSSWAHYPIDRKLRTIHHNHPHRNDTTYHHNTNHHERNDHVSLLSPSTNRVHPFHMPKSGKQRGRVNANDYQDYLAQYVRDFNLMDYMKMNTNVVKVKRLTHEEDGAFDRFLLELESMDTNQQLTCAKVIWSVGVTKPNIPPQAKIPSKAIVHYSDLPLEYGPLFSGKNVLVVGSGTSAFEVLDSTWEYANKLNLVAGSEGIRLELENGNPDGLPTSALAALDYALLPGYESNNIHIHRIGCARDGWVLTLVNGTDTVPGMVNGTHRVRYRCLKRDHGWRSHTFRLKGEPPTQDLEQYEIFPHRGVTNGDFSVLHRKRKGGKKAVSTKRSAAEAHHEGTGTVGDGVYDSIVLCTGFEMDVSMFDKTSACVPNMDSHAINTLPRLRPNYESWNIPGLYFNGALTHGRDYDRGNGGTLRGFRYTSRALFRHLQRLEHAETGKQDVWPATTTIGDKKSLDKVAEMILARVRNATGIYHMHEDVCDVITYDSKRHLWVYMEEVPIDGVPRLLHFGKRPPALDVQSNTNSSNRRYKQYMSLCYGGGNGQYASTDTYVPRWRGDFEGDRAFHAKHHFNMKKIHLSKGGESGTGIDSDRLHPVLSYYDLTNPVQYRSMEHGGPDRQSAVGYGISHVLFPMAALHLMDDPTFEYQLYYMHVHPLTTWLNVFGKSMSSKKGWKFGEKIKKEAREKGKMRVPRFSSKKYAGTEVHVECYGMEYDIERIEQRQESTPTMQNFISRPQGYAGGLHRIPRTSKNRKMTLSTLSVESGYEDNGGGGTTRELGDGSGYSPGSGGMPGGMPGGMFDLGSHVSFVCGYR